MKEYLLSVKVRNNLILNAIKDAGGETGQLWCVENGLSYEAVNKYINIAISPIGLDGNYKKSALALCDVLNKTPYDLWTEKQLSPLANNKKSTEISENEIDAYLSFESSRGISNDIDSFDISRVVNSALDQIPEREKKVLQMVVYGEMTLNDCGSALGISGVRVKQIMEKALRRMRSPSISKELRPYVGYA